MKKTLVCGLLVALLLVLLSVSVVSAETVEPKIMLYNGSVSFEGAVEYNIYFRVQGMDGVGPEDMGLALFRTNDPEGTVDTAFQVVTGAQQGGALYMVRSAGIPAKELGDKVYFRVFAKLTDGSYVYSKPNPYSLRIYADQVLASSSDEKLKELVIRALQYGASAQVYFDYETDLLMDYCIPPKTHGYDDRWTVETAPTLEAEGSEYRLCTVCGKGREDRAIPMLTLQGLEVTGQPAKTDYYTNEVFDPAGMEIVALISDGSRMPVTDYAVDKTVLTAEDTFVTVSYRDVRCQVPVTVSPIPLVSVGDLGQIVDDTLVLAEGLYVGVAEEGPSADREVLLKDLSSDALIALRGVPYGSFPDYGYEKGDRVRILATVDTDTTVNTPNKRHLDFSPDNGEIESTVVSSGNQVAFTMDNVVEVTSWEQMKALFTLGNIPDYTMVRLTGSIYFNRYEGSDGVTVSRIHMDGDATGVSGIRTDGSRTVSLRDVVMEKNLGEGWYKCFFDEFPATGKYPGKELKGSLTAVYTGGNNYYHQLTVLDSEWVALSEYDQANVVVEVADAFYRQGTQIQYDQTQSRRNLRPSPEDATALRTMYLDCSSFVDATYFEAFGVGVMDSTKTPSTANFTDYAVEGLGTRPDVIGYWENGDYTTGAQIAGVLAEVRQQLQVGDVLVYRHGETEGSSGHTYIYLGDDTFIHCTGSSFNYTDDPAASYDKGTSAEKTGGAVQLIGADKIFEDTTSTRYLFKVTAEDSVFNFCLLRPLARGLTITDETLDRMAMGGVDLEMTVDVGEYGTVAVGGQVTCTVTMTNTTGQDQTGVVLAQALPEGTRFVSGTEGVSLTEGEVCWTGTVAAGETVEVSYDLQVTDAVTVRTVGTAGGVGLNQILVTVSGGSTDEAALARKDGAAAVTYSDPIALAKKLYPALLGDVSSVKEALDQLIDTKNKTCRTDTALSQALVPELYGGLSIKSGFLKDNRRIRLVKEDHLEVGDLILAQWGQETVVMVYLGQGELVQIRSTDDVCRIVTMSGDAFTSSNVLCTLIAYDRFAVLRPSMVG